MLDYPHTVGRSVIGGFVYRGQAIPALAGRYVFGDWSTSTQRASGALFVATPGATPWPFARLVAVGRRQVLALGQGRRNELYVLTADGEVGPGVPAGTVWKLVRR